MSIGSHHVSWLKTKLITNNEQLLNVTDLLPITYGIIVSPSLSQINPGTLDEKKNLKDILSKFY